jgi:hypothetical protein
MMVGTARSVIGLERAAGDWRVTGRTLESAYISALMPIPDERLLFASAHHGTIHCSHDGGLTWEKKDQGIRTFTHWARCASTARSNFMQARSRPTSKLANTEKPKRIPTRTAFQAPRKKISWRNVWPSWRVQMNRRDFGATMAAILVMALFFWP